MLAGSEHLRPTSGIKLTATTILAAALLGALILSGGRAAVEPQTAFAQSCAAKPKGLAPEGPGPNRFTMMIRINQQVNVNTYANFDTTTGGLGSYVRPQDIFVINTRFETTTPTVAAQLAAGLRAAFPCNRIIALTGLGLNPAAPGYAFSLAGNPSVWALMTDFEAMDWNGTAGTAPGRPPWDQAFKVAFPRIKSWNGRLTKSAGANQRTGLVPIFDSTWNYGQIAQDIDKKNRRLGDRHVGPLSVQTQDACADGGASAFTARVKGIFDQYRYKTIVSVKKVMRKGKLRKVKVKRRVKLKPRARPLLPNLATQISFSDTPNPNAGMAITKTSAGTAAACARAGLKAGGGAFFFFASDDSMRLLFNQPQIASLRPSATGGPTGGISGPKPKK